ncbi:hypothetical protein WICMUC_000427 [Wickerhamomyces mucosus]|uniref:Cleavage/polyadenylation specificity factor A subunit C-terminal domain-containing protein n=1 Tax=Wickerhamomyces mucosus TaxID=1378264 RepID=A0A9P8PXN6_9ASCO|nr:hypothetical protein WICMUC_000427 [Wickerhamomyces mucosus]
MDVFQEIVDPSLVTSSLSCHFTSIEQKDLIVVKNTILQIFQIIDNKLQLINEFLINGKIIGIKSISLSKISKLDSLIVLTEFAKISIVAFDENINSIQTISLHYYETEIQNRLTSPIVGQPQLKIDPNNTVSLVHYRDILCFLPLYQDDFEDDELISNDQFFGNSSIVQSKHLHQSISNIIDCTFLYNYRDPTLAIIYNSDFTWGADLSNKKDTVNFIIISIDLTNGSATPIINVENLPYDTYKLYPLPSPLNGVLLMGCNQIIHIDTQGNIKGIATNVFAKNTTNQQLLDQSDLQLFLEFSEMEYLGGNDVLIINKLGIWYKLKFELDGKIIKNLKLERELNQNFQDELIWCNGITSIDDNYLFISSTSSDSILFNKVKAENETIQLNQQRKTKRDLDEDEDMLYEDENEEINLSNQKFQLVKTDTMINNGPITSSTLGKLSPNETVQGLVNPSVDDISLITTTGEGKNSSITCFKPTIQPLIHSTLKFTKIQKSWNLLNKYLITTDSSNYKSEIFLIQQNFKNFQTLDFRNNNITVNIDVLNGDKIVQVCLNNLYLFDLNFRKLLQINFDFEVLNAKISNGFILITTSKGENKIFELIGKKINRVKIPKLITELILNFGIITKAKLAGFDEDEIWFLITTIKNQILLFNKKSDKVWVIQGINKLSDICTIQELIQQENLIPDPWIKEISLMEFDNNIKNADLFLTILTIGGEIIQYRLFSNNSKLQKLPMNIITGAPENVYSESTILERKLIQLNIQNRKILFVSGQQPYLIIKTPQTFPKIFKFTSKNAISICPINEDGKEERFMYIDTSQNARICSLNENYESNLPITKFKVGKTVNNVAFNETSNLLTVSSLIKHDYQAIDEDGEEIVGTEQDKPKAENYSSELYLINPINWIIIDTIKFEPNEVVNDIKSNFLTISSRSKRQKEFLILGLGKYRMEDLSVYGVFKLYDIISIVPDPSHPEINFKFKEISNELIKGAVTKISEISGRFLISQGQKIIIRDLQQDNSTVPVAFYDIPTNISDAKSFSNLVLLADELKSIHLLAFDAEPYRLISLGKDLKNDYVMSADFLVNNGDINLIIGNEDEEVRVLRYDPDDVNSLLGQRLLEKSKIKVYAGINSFINFPKFETFEKSGKDSFQDIGITTTGSIFKIIPIDEINYRTLYILQQQLDKAAPYLGLNPKERLEGLIINFNFIKNSFMKLDLDKRSNVCGKVGKSDGEVFKSLIEIENSLKGLCP